tara:strand:+ start:7636 stop:8139 length:504 start_codon:yes stop_codon:yes gene_type:complete
MFLGHSQINFPALVEEYYKPLYRFAYSLAGNEHEACDLTQQTFCIYARKGQAIEKAAKVKSWLFTTLYREFLKLRRKAQRTTPVDHETLDYEAPHVSVDMVKKIDSSRAVDSLQAVDEVYRTPLTLFYLKHHSYQEIADVLDIPLGTVMSRISRGKTQLKKVLTNPS